MHRAGGLVGVHPNGTSDGWPLPLVDAAACDPGGGDPDEQFLVTAGPWVDTGRGELGALGTVLHRVGGPLDHHAPAFACGGVNAVDLESHLVVGALDAGAQILIQWAGRRGAKTIIPLCSR